MLAKLKLTIQLGIMWGWKKCTWKPWIWNLIESWRAKKKKLDKHHRGREMLPPVMPFVVLAKGYDSIDTALNYNKCYSYTIHRNLAGTAGLAKKPFQNNSFLRHTNCMLIII